MRKLVFCVLFSIFFLSGNGQLRDADSLLKILSVTQTDTTKVRLLVEISRKYSYVFPDTALQYAQQAYAISKLTPYPFYEARSLYAMGLVMSFTGNYPKALKLQLEALQIFEKLDNTRELARIHNLIGITYREQGDPQKALEHFNSSRQIAVANKSKLEEVIALTNIGGIYGILGELDSALVYELQAYELDKRTPSSTGTTVILKNLGNINFKLGNYKSSEDYFYQCISNAMAINDNRDLSESLIGLARIAEVRNKPDSAIYYAKQSLAVAQKADMPKYLLDASIFLSQKYEEMHVADSAFKYYKLSMATKDVLYNQERDKQVQNLSFDEKMRQQDIANEKSQLARERKNNLQMLLIGVFIIGFLVFVFAVSRRFIEPRTIELLGLLGLLLTFEFINLLVHPFVAQWTDHEPVLMLLILVGIASLLVPTHHHLIKWVQEKIVYRKKYKKTTGREMSGSPY